MVTSEEKGSGKRRGKIEAGEREVQTTRYEAGSRTCYSTHRQNL